MNKSALRCSRAPRGRLVEDAIPVGSAEDADDDADDEEEKDGDIEDSSDRSAAIMSSRNKNGMEG